MQPYSLSDIYEPVSKLTPDVILYLPRTSDLNELAIYVPEQCKISVIHYCIKGYSKVSVLNKFVLSLTLTSWQAICAYFGNFTWKKSS